jgi:hypothetical protein|nr:MAG TPA: hypothetical protein [Caudoviricetes sp.]
MRIETPIDRAQNRSRRAALLLERQEAAKKENEGILGNPEAWNLAFERALAQRNQELADQQDAVVIPAEIIKRTGTEEVPTDGKLERRISRELARFLNGMSLGAVSAAVILWAIMIAAGVL